MDQILKLKNEVEDIINLKNKNQNLFEEIHENEIEQQIEQEKDVENRNMTDQQIILYNQRKDLNIWDYVKKTIEIAEQIKDKELFQGAMSLVREILYMILFEQIRNWNNEELIESLDNLPIILNIINTQTFFNLINPQICNELSFIINQSKHLQQLSILEKAISLSTSIILLGLQVNKHYIIDKFSLIFKDQNPISTLQLIVNDEINDQNQQTRINKERLQLQTAICLSYILKNYLFDANTFNKCMKIFQLKLSTFVQQFEPYSTENSSMNEYSLNLNNKINEIDIETIRNVLISLENLCSDQRYAIIMINQYKIHENILRFIHLDCNCLLSIYNSKMTFTQILKSSAFRVISKLFRVMTQQKVNKLNSKHNIIAHIILFFHSNFDRNFINKISSSSFLSNIKSNEIIQQITNIYSALSLLYELMIYSAQILSQVISEPNLITKLVQIVENNQLNGILSVESIKIRIKSYQIINLVNIFGNVKQIYWMIYQLKEIELVKKYMCQVGGLGSDDEDILCISVQILYSLLDNLSNTKIDIDEKKKLLNVIKDSIEEDGLVEENNALIFHSDDRFIIGIQTKATELNSEINY